MTRAEAANVLGVAADAGAETVRSAYRERIKEVHPDTDDGDQEAFKQVRDAYERLQE
jgi:curved DNA-binding protein CbpA